MSHNNNQDFIATKAVIIYEQKKNGTQHYAEVHLIENGQFKSGRPLLLNELSELTALANSKTDQITKSCFPHRNILGFNLGLGNDTLIWIHPAAEVPLLFTKEVEALESGKFFLPALVFCYNRSKLEVYAIKRNDVINPSEKTKLYHAPLFNVFDTGSVCMGNAKIKKSENLTELIHNIEFAFFRSQFSHTNHNDIVKGNLIDVYTEANFKKKFPESKLIESKSLNQLFNE